jgi:hypothetical protein
MTPSPWITLDEAVQYLRMGGKHPKKVIAYWCKRKMLKYAKRSRTYLFKQDWLDGFVMLNAK